MPGSLRGRAAFPANPRMRSSRTLAVGTASSAIAVPVRARSAGRRLARGGLVARPGRVTSGSAFCRSPR